MTANQIAESVLEKVALNLAEARGAYQRFVKPKLVRRAKMLVHGIPSGNRYARRGYPTAETAVQALHPAYPNKRILMGGNQPGLKGATPKEQEMFNRMTGLHEGFEAKYTPQKLIRGRIDAQDYKYKSGLPESMTRFLHTSHIDPRVIMAESNMVASLPPNLRSLRGVYESIRRRSREGGEYSRWADVVPGFRYGETKLTPAMRKQIMRKLYS